MAKAIKRRRGTTEEHKNFVGLDGEITVNTTENRLVLHDQTTMGGHPIAKKSEVDAVQKKVDSSVQITGNQTINGEKTFVDSPKVPTVDEGDSSDKVASTEFVNGAIDKAKEGLLANTGNVELTNGKLIVPRTLTLKSDLEKGTLPINYNSDNEIYFCDSTDTDYAHATGVLSQATTPEGSSVMLMRALDPVNVPSIHTSELQAVVLPDGTPSTYAPTPIKNLDHEITTVKWVKDYVNKERPDFKSILNLYVSKSGNDSNDGLSEATAFLSIQKAVDTACTYKGNYIHNIVINIGEGWWNEHIILHQHSGNWALLRGKGTNVTYLQCTWNSEIIATVQQALWTVSNCAIDISFSDNANSATRIYAGINSHLDLADIVIQGTAPNSTILHVDYNAMCILYNFIAVNITAATKFVALTNSARMVGSANVQLTINGTYSQAVFGLYTRSTLYINMPTPIYGTAIGPRFDLQQFSIIDSAGRGLYFIPGTIDGNIAANSIYY